MARAKSKTADFQKKIRAAGEMLKGKNVVKVVGGENGSEKSVQIIFGDGMLFSISLRQGGGADGGWYNWTVVEASDPLRSVKILDE